VRALCVFRSLSLSIIVTAVTILIVSHVEAGLIDARVQTLLAQGEIIGMATASQGTESDAINIDPEFPVSPERVAPLVRRRLITPTNAAIAIPLPSTGAGGRLPSRRPGDSRRPRTRCATSSRTGGRKPATRRKTRSNSYREEAFALP
jgi:hypothetical protein